MDGLENTKPCVLVVDDEEAIREAVRDILELIEVKTILAANGQEAMDLYAEHRDKIHAILLDLRMPVISGSETYRKLREMGATITIILSSGYDDKVSSINFEQDHALLFLRKPYALETLLTCIQQALA
jgi:DNA-binding NtrC family response regulator